MHPLLILLILLAVVFGVRWLREQPPERRREAGFKAALGAAALILLVAVATGKLNVLTGLIAAAIPIAQRIMTARALIDRLRGERPTATGRGERNDSAEHATPARGPTGMDVDEAARTLGVATHASREGVIRAHRTLIQRLHPDRGGSTELANRVNRAKDVLLARR